MTQILYVITGVVMGAFSGFLGIGGGLILIPILIYGFGLTQHQAQGTSLAVMVLPITLAAAFRYYQSGNVKISMVIFIAAGFAVGGLIGAHAVQFVSDNILRKTFGVIMLLASVKMIFF